MNYLKQRNLILVIILAIVTCGIYGLYLYFQFNSEVNKQAIADGVQTIPRTPLIAFLLSIITCGIYGIVYQYFVAKSLQEIGRKRNYEAVDPILVIILTIFVGVGGFLNIYSGSKIAELDANETL